MNTSAILLLVVLVSLIIVVTLLIRSSDALLFDIKRMLSLEIFFSKDFGVSDLLLPECFCDEGIILNRDGSFTQCFWYSGAPYDSSSEEELSYLNTVVYSRAFAYLGDNWTMHLDCDSIETKGYISPEDCYFPDPTSYCIDTERRFKYEAAAAHYLNRFVLSFTYLPPADNSEKSKNWFLEDREGLPVEYYDHLKYFKDTIKKVLDQLSYMVYTKALTNSETMTFLNKCINGIEHTFEKNNHSWLELYYRLANQDLIKGTTPRIGKYYIGACSVGEGFPPKATPALLHELTTLQFDYRWSTRFIFFDKSTAQKYLDKSAEYHYQSREDIKKALGNKNRGESTKRINRSADVLADQVEQALASLDLEGVTFGKYSCSIIVFDEDKKSLENKLEIIHKIVNNVGLLAKIEEANTLDTYLSAIPGMVRNNVRKWIMDTINLADLMPTTDVWAGYEKNPCSFYVNNNPPLFYASTRTGAPFRGCLHVDDLGHTFIAGPSRAGKSVLLNFIAAQEFRYKNTQIFHYDNGYSGQILCFAMNGSHYDIGSDNTLLNFKPLALVDNPEDFTFLVQWLCEIAELNLNRQVNADEKNDITRVLEIIRQQGTPEQKSMSYFYFQLKALAKNNELAQAFIGYTTAASNSSIKSSIFNATKDTLSFSKFSMFELEKLLKMSDDIFIPAIRYLFHMNYRALDGSPTTIIIEEFQRLAQHPIGQRMLDEILRRWAKKGCKLILVTQQLNDILKSPIYDVIEDQCKTKIFLPNPSILNNEKTPKLYEQFGLNNKQISLIGNATPMREYYFANPLGHRLFNLDLQDVALAFLAKTNPDNLKLARQLKLKYKDQFGYSWLKHFKLDAAAEYWAISYKNIIRGESNV